MEIDLTNGAVAGFEAGISHLQDENFLSRLLRLLSQSLKINSLCIWIALLLAATIAAFVPSFLPGSRNARSSTSVSESLPSSDDTDTDEDNDDDASSESSDSDSCDGSSHRKEEDFRVLSGSIRKDPSRSFEFWESEGSHGDCFSGGVVRLWNEMRIGLDKSGGFLSMWDMNKGEILMSLIGVTGQTPAIAVPSPAVVVSAGVENARTAAMRIWDARVDRRPPSSAVAEWQPRRGRVVGIGLGEGDKVFVREHGGSVVVRDLRKPSSALEETADSDGQIWFDADGDGGTELGARD